MDDQPTLFIAQLVREAITRTIIVKRIIYGRWGTRFVEEKTARLGVRLNYDASGEYKQGFFASLVNRTPPWQCFVVTRKEAKCEQIVASRFRLGHRRSASDHGIRSHYNRIRKTDLWYRESHCQHDQESHPLSHSDGRLHHGTGADWRSFAFGWFRRTLAGTPVRRRVRGGDLLRPSPHTRMV